MASHIPKIHDRFAKRSLHELPIAHDFLKAHLPKEILAQIDLNTIRPINTDFVPDSLKEFLSDVVYECRIKGQLGYILALIEHQLMEGLLQQHALNRLQSTAECIYWLLQSNIMARTLEGTTGNYLECVVSYVAQTGDAGGKAETRKLLSDIAANLSEDKGERVMTIAEILRNEGMQAGMQQGMQQGEQHRNHVIAQNMLRDGLPESTISKYTGLELDEVVALKKQIFH